MKAEPVLHDGQPERNIMLPYGRQWLDENDIAAVVEVLRSDWLTTGPKVGEFEKAFAKVTGSSEAVAVSSGTAALHAAMHALNIGPGDEVIVPAMTFAASANCIVYQGGEPVFVDVDPDTLLVDPGQVESKLTSRTKAVIAVDYAGQSCDYDALRAITEPRGLPIVADACHAIGGSYHGRPVGSLADLSTFSLHPVKHMTTGEGGMITTSDPLLAQRMRVFRNHGITTDHHQRELQGSWFYEMVDLGYNYRLTDFQCALGLSQLRKLPTWVSRRREIAHEYDEHFSRMTALQPLAVRTDVVHAYHLYMVRLKRQEIKLSRQEVFAGLRAKGIGVNVHYIPVHMHPYYRERFGTGQGLCPVAEAAYEELITLPIFPAMTNEDVDFVVASLESLIK